MFSYLVQLCLRTPFQFVCRPDLAIPTHKLMCANPLQKGLAYLKHPLQCLQKWKDLIRHENLVR